MGDRIVDWMNREKMIVIFFIGTFLFLSLSGAAGANGPPCDCKDKENIEKVLKQVKDYLESWRETHRKLHDKGTQMTEDQAKADARDGFKAGSGKTDPEEVGNIRFDGNRCIPVVNEDVLKKKIPNYCDAIYDSVLEHESVHCKLYYASFVTTPLILIFGNRVSNADQLTEGEVMAHLAQVAYLEARLEALKAKCSALRILSSSMAMVGNLLEEARDAVDRVSDYLRSIPGN